MMSPEEVLLVHVPKIVQMYLQKCEICQFCIYATGRLRVKFNKIRHQKEVLLARGPQIV